MLFADSQDIRRCMEVVKIELEKKNITVEESVLQEITEDIMNISYAKGGDYSNKIIRAYAEGYIGHGLYKKFL